MCDPSSVPSGAALLSVRRTFPGPLASGEVLRRVRALFQTLAPYIMTDGILLGHLKAAIHSECATFTLSMTREDCIDETPSPTWDPCAILSDYEIIVSLLSIRPCDLSNANLEQLLLQLNPL